MWRPADPLARLTGRVDWIELVVGFACNCHCRVCTSHLAADTPPLDFAALADWLARGRVLGATKVWLGGGEPTLHDDLPRTIAQARKLGYRCIRLQSNGLRLAYPAYLAALVDAGLTEAALSVKDWNARTHDALVRRDGAWELLGGAFANLRAAGLRAEADILLTTPLLPHLPALVEELARRGVAGITFWLTSLHGLPDADAAAVARLVPPLRALREPLRAAFARASARRIAATSLHVPPCALAPEDRGRYFHAGRYRLLVVVPGGAPFMAEESPMERGEHPREPCGRCAVRKECLGLRADQLRLYGIAGLEPVARTPRSKPRPVGSRRRAARGA